MREMNAARRRGVDRYLLLSVSLLMAIGALVFGSALLGLLARGEVSASSITFNQLILGFGGGIGMMFLLSTIDFRRWRLYAPYLFIGSLGLTALVFIPGLGYEAGGATRWITFLGFSMQPSETLKLGMALMAAHYFSLYRSETDTFTRGIGSFIALVSIPCVLLLLQPDTGTLGVIIVACASAFFAAGARWRDIALLIISAFMMLAILAMFRPYVMDRITTFINPGHDPLGSSYQVQQSLIAIGSGGTWGRGFGQGIQKFEHLPEPATDSIFAVFAEEFGFIGSSLLIILFLFFVGRGIWLASHIPDVFGALLMTSISSYIGTQVFINIASLLGIFPLTGIPLVFISQGGTALLISLSAVGIMLNISRYRRF